MTSLFRSSKSKLASKSSRDGPATEQRSSREDVLSPETTHGSKSGSPEISKRSALKSKMNFFGASHTIRVQLAADSVCDAPVGRVGMTATPNVSPLVSAKVKTKKGDHLSDILERAILKFTESGAFAGESTGMVNTEEYQLYRGDGTALQDTESVDDCHLPEDAVLFLVKRGAEVGNLIARESARSPLGSARGSTHDMGVFGRPLGETEGLANQLLAELAVRARQDKHLFDERIMSPQVDQYRHMIDSGRVVDFGACDAKDVGGLLQLYLSSIPEDRGLVQFQHANLLLDAKNTPIPTACMRSVVLQMPKPHRGFLAKLCALLSTVEPENQEKAAAVWGPLAMRQSRPEDAAAVFSTLIKSYADIFTNVRPQIIKLIARQDFTNVSELAPGELALGAGDIVFVVHGEPADPYWFGMCKGRPGYCSKDYLSVVFDNIEDYSAQGAGNAWVAIGGPSAPATRQEESVAARFQEPSAMIARSVETPPQPGAVSGSQPALNRTASPLPAATPQFTLSRDDELPDSTNPFESPSIAELAISTPSATVTHSTNPFDDLLALDAEPALFSPTSAPPAAISSASLGLSSQKSMPMPTIMPDHTIAAPAVSDDMFSNIGAASPATGLSLTAPTTTSAAPVMSLLDADLDEPAGQAPTLQAQLSHTPAPILTPTPVAVLAPATPDLHSAPTIAATVATVSADVPSGDGGEKDSGDNDDIFAAIDQEDRIEALREEFTREAALLASAETHVQELSDHLAALVDYAKSLEQDNELIREDIRAKGALPVA